MYCWADTIAHTFTPFAIVTLGSWGLEATLLVLELGRRIAVVTGEPQSASFLRQRIHIAMQRGNAAAILPAVLLGTFVRISSFADLLHIISCRSGTVCWIFLALW